MTYRKDMKNRLTERKIGVEEKNNDQLMKDRMKVVVKERER